MNTRQKIAIAGVISGIVRAIRSLLGKGDVGIFRRGEIVWELDLREGIDFAIYLRGGFEPRTLQEYRRLVRPGSVVLDIGANIGSHTLPLAQLVGPSGRVYAFEPTDYAFGKQRRNLSLNPELSKRVGPFQVMLAGRRVARKPETIPSSWPLDRRRKMDLHPTHFGRFNTLAGAELLRLDDWTAREQPRSIDFVKMDVDGYEIEVIEGAGQTLSRYKPAMMMEFAPYIFPERGRSFPELLEALSALGYRARTMKGKGLALEPALETAIPRKGSMNVILEAG